MTTYIPPLRDIAFALDVSGGLSEISQLSCFEEASADLVKSILIEAGKIAELTLAPLNQIGDRQGAQLINDTVTTPEGWGAAWQVLVDGGWNGLPYPVEFGGMGLPNLVNAAVQEMWQSANMAFALCPLLTQGAVNAISLYGTDQQKALYLPKLVTGEWTGTMNLTEPNAGSDVGAVRTRAVPDEGQYRITGQKIFITYGDHDLAKNIIHLVLARLPDAPPGVKGLSLFIVPKFVLNENGDPAASNEVHCVSLEHKLGIHGSPTAILSFGDHDGSLGDMVGEPNRGLEYMFAMMNHARQSVGMQGLSIAERAYQQALSYARDRVQGKPMGWKGDGNAPIVHHPDVRRMLLSMKSRIEAMRGVLYSAAAAVDRAHHHSDSVERQTAAQLVEILTPIAKGWCTEMGVEIASLGVQIHGGMGYIEETGAAQHFRDSRITTIYEGTTGIQANDLVGRKVLRDNGACICSLLSDIRDFTHDLTLSSEQRLQTIGGAMVRAADLAKTSVLSLVKSSELDPRLPFSVAVPFLHLMGILIGGYHLARSASMIGNEAVKQKNSDEYLNARVDLAAFYMRHVLPEIDGLAFTVSSGAEVVLATNDELF